MAAKALDQEKDVVMTLSPGVIVSHGSYGMGAIILILSKTIRSPTFTYLFHRPWEDITSSGLPKEFYGLLNDVYKLNGLHSLLLTQSTEEGPSTALWRRETAKLAEKISSYHGERSWSGWLNELLYISFRIQNNWILWKRG